MTCFDRPKSNEYGSFYSGYVAKVSDGNILESLEELSRKHLSFFKDIPGDKWSYRYAPGKWSVKEILVHLLDSERIFAYRILRIMRGDQTALPGFDQDDYIPESRAGQRNPGSLIREYEVVRAATVSLVSQFDDQNALRTTVASGHPVSARALAWIIAGHEIHHMEVIRDRYL